MTPNCEPNDDGIGWKAIDRPNPMSTTMTFLPSIGEQQLDAREAQRRRFICPLRDSTNDLMKYSATDAHQSSEMCECASASSQRAKGRLRTDVRYDIVKAQHASGVPSGFRPTDENSQATNTHCTFSSSITRDSSQQQQAHSRQRRQQQGPSRGGGGGGGGGTAPKRQRRTELWTSGRLLVVPRRCN